MKNIRIITLICIVSLFLISCEKEKEIEIVKLYPAYETRNNREYWGYIDENGKFKTPKTYDTATEFEDGLALVEKDGFFGVIDSRGREILSPIYTNIGKVGNGYITAFKDKSVMVFDYQGENLITSREYRNIGEYSDDLFTVVKLDKEGSPRYGFINKEGEEVIEADYTLAYPFYLGRSIVRDDDKFKLIDKMGKTVTNIEHSEVKPTREIGHYIFSNTGETFGLLNKDGRIILKEEYSAIVEIKEGLVVVGKTEGNVELFGVMDTRGNKVIDIVYDDIKLLGQGYIGISRETGLAGKNIYSILNDKKELISKEKFYNVGGNDSTIKNGIISVSNEIETFAIDLNGRRVEHIPISQGFGEVYSDGSIVRTFIDDELIYYNMDGEIIWEADYTYGIDKEKEIIVKEVKNNILNIKYPYFIGFEDREKQDIINKLVYESFYNEKDLQEEAYRYYKTKYNIDRSKDIVTIERTTKYVRKGDISEIIEKDLMNIDIRQGTSYRLGDIIKTDDKSIGLFLDIVEDMGDSLNIEVEKLKPLKKDEGFKIVNNKLYIYLTYKEGNSLYRTYEEIDISMDKLKEVLDYQSQFFKGFGN